MSLSVGLVVLVVLVVLMNLRGTKESDTLDAIPTTDPSRRRDCATRRGAAGAASRTTLGAPWLPCLLGHDRTARSLRSTTSRAV